MASAGSRWRLGVGRGGASSQDGLDSGVLGLGSGGQGRAGAPFGSYVYIPVSSTSLSFPFRVLFPNPAANHERQMDQHRL